MEPSPTDPHQRADWRRVAGTYEQLSQILDDPEKENEPHGALPGTLAEALARTFASYDGTEEQFIDDFLAIMAKIDGRTEASAELMEIYYRDPRLDRLQIYTDKGIRGKRRPKPLEAAVETVRRLRDLNVIRDSLEGLHTCGVLGGSASYGRFFNTVGAAENDASDVDLMVIVPSQSEILGVLERIDEVAGVSGIAEALSRSRDFAGAKAKLPDGARCLFSHKLKMWESEDDPRLFDAGVGGEYTLSLHLISREDFDFVILRDLPQIDDGWTRSIWDFRNTDAKREDNQRSFSGIDETVPRECFAVGNSWLAESLVCHVKDNRFYPGLHQNLVLPQFDLRWQTHQHRLTLPLLAFRWKIVERLREEKRLRPFEVQAISQSHTRTAVFAPHIVRRVDSYD